MEHVDCILAPLIGERCRAGCRHAKRYSRSHSVCAALGLDGYLWICGHKSTSAISCSHPPGGDWQIIYRHGSSIESVIRKAWSIARETESRQAVAIGEAVFADVGDAGWGSDVGQAGAFIERGIADIGDAVGDGITSGQARRKLNERAFAFIEQDPRHTAIGRIVGIHVNGCQAGTRAEGKFGKAGDAGGDHHIGQAVAVEKSSIGNAGNIGADCDASQAAALAERVSANIGNAAGNCDIGQAVAGIERIVADADDYVGDSIASSQARRTLNERGLAFVEQNPRHTAIGRIVGIHVYGRQTGGPANRIRDAGQRFHADARNAAGNGDAGQAAAAIECVCADAGDVRANRDKSQANAPMERVVTDAGDAVGDRNVGQAGAVLECAGADAGDVGANREAGYQAAHIKCVSANAGHPIAIGRGGDDNRAARTGVPRDGDASVIRYEIELGLRHGGQQ